MSHVFKRRGFAAVFAASAFGLVATDSIAEEPVVMPRVDVIGSRDNLDAIPGTGDVLNQDVLEQSRVVTTNEALRKVPGVTARDEEGFGLRPNIGIRGLNPTRSTKVLLLEDGIPLAYAPYGDNASYYHPPIDRFESIEVLKGVDMLRFGPQTIGGVINYITPAPPAEFGGRVSGALGNRDYANGRLRVGGRRMLFDVMRKQGDGARDHTDSTLDDLNAKVVLDIGERQALTLRANFYREDSTLTYSGLTQAEFDNLGPRYNPFKNDKFDGRRDGASATHEIELGADAVLTTNFYGARFKRDWWRQASTTTDAQCGAAFTSARAAGVAVDPDACNSVQGRLREYYFYGVEPRLAVGAFEAGLRVHVENQDRVQKNGTSPLARDGTVVEDNERDTNAYAAFVQHRFEFGRVHVTPVLRVERIKAGRTNQLTGVEAESTLTEWIPGIGATFHPDPQTTWFVGAHEGFAPPRTEDLIGATGTFTDVDPEKSLNLEAGVRHRRDHLALQAALFRNDFDNQIAVGSIAGGSTPLAQGETLYQGLELSTRLGPERGAGPFFTLAYTWLAKAESTAPFREVANGAVVAGSRTGNRLPYAPEHTVTSAVGYRHAAGWDAQLEVVFVDDQWSDFAHTKTPTVDGQRGLIDAYALWNASTNYRLGGGLSLYATVKNLADKTYIVDRTRGILPGAPRLVQAGVQYDF